MDSDNATLLQRLSPIIAPRVAARMKEESPERARTISDDEALRLIGLTLEALTKAIARDPPSAYADFWGEWSYERSRTGVPFEHMRKVLTVFHEVVLDALKEARATEPLLQVQALEQCCVLFQSGVFALFRGYQEGKDELIKAQEVSIRQLSTPIMPVYKGVLVVPLIGVIDAERASEMTSQLLSGVSRARCNVVILDITGVPLIDADTAHRLIGAARAVELLGARLVLVGVTPRAAQALVHLGVEAGALRTLADLQSGLEYALRIQGLEIAPRSRGSDRYP
jgi:rsbT co-antagonist protein RsbR